MRRFLIERPIPDIGSADRAALGSAARKSNDVLAEMQSENKKIQWEHSYVADDKTFCIYLAEDGALIDEHSKSSGFPATVVTPLGGVIDPTTAEW